MTFMTPAVQDVTNVTSVSVTFDLVSRHADVQFEYVNNPTITDIRPLSSFLRCAFSWKFASW